MAVFSKQIFEIRFKPNPLFADFLGLWGKKIMDLLQFSDFGLDGGRFTVVDNRRKRAAFISLQNLGGMVAGEIPESEICSFAQNYLDILFGLEHFKLDDITFLGVRTQSLTEVDRSFKEVMESFNHALIREPAGIEQSTGLSISDSSIVMEFHTDRFDTKIQAGPMTKEQFAGQYVTELQGEILPNVGIFLDTDTKKKGTAQSDKKTLLSLIEKFQTNNRSTLAYFTGLVLASRHVEKEQAK